MSDSDRPAAKGRGSPINPPNRFGGPHYELDLEQIAEARGPHPGAGAELPRR